ncbi:MAG: hypothetical protein PHE53_04520, partial [Thermoguttaceae bacterium]|nr:hypothetical protein [Thermoguttaceae bacterium]
MKNVLMFLFIWIFSHSICCGTESGDGITANQDEIKQEVGNEQESLVFPPSVTPLELPISGGWGLKIFGDIWGDGVEELGDPGEHASYHDIPFQTLQDEERKQPASLYVRMKWDANQYFADQPQTIQLCKAIEEGSVEKVDQAIADGADVNAIGLDHMTPLMWAFPSSFEVFEHLLRKGANPNVAYSGRYNFHSFL